MRFILEDLAASTFGVEHVLSEPGAPLASMEVYFGPSEGVGGSIDVAGGNTHFVLCTEGPLQLDRFAGPMRRSQVQVASDLRLHSVDIDLKMRGAILDGKASFAKAKAAAFRVNVPALEEFAASGVHVADFDLKADNGDVRIRIARIEFALLPILLPTGSIRLERVRCENVSLSLNPQGTWEAKIRDLRAGRVAYSLDGIEGSFEDLRISGAKVASSEKGPTFFVDSLSVKSLHARSQELQVLLASPSSVDKAMPPTAPSQEVLALLDLLSGTFNVDVVTSVDLPLLPSWRAKHPVRITIEDGTVNYEELENSIGSLADAVLDFRVDGHMLKLDKDIPLIPFDRQTLVRWPLPERERALARRGRVRLARLTQPLVEVEANPKGTDKGVRFLEEILAKSIDVSLRVGHQASVKLPAGATLRLGAKDTPGVESLVIKGNIVYRTDASEDEGTVQLGLRRSNVALSDVYVAGKRFSAGVEVETVALNTRFLDIRPTAFELSLERAKVTSLALTPSFPDARPPFEERSPSV